MVNLWEVETKIIYEMNDSVNRCVNLEEVFVSSSGGLSPLFHFFKKCHSSYGNKCSYIDINGSKCISYSFILFVELKNSHNIW